MSEPITIPAGFYERREAGAVSKEVFDNVLDWLRANGINPNGIPDCRDIVIREDVIEYWEIVPSDAEDAARDFPAGAGRMSHTLQPGEEWSDDGEFAKAIRLAKDELRIPLPDDLRAAIA
jgi:hypothetical protein